MTLTTPSPIKFAFGKNWQHYVATQLNPARVAAARQHLLRFLKLQDLRGKVFLDIGSGSGINSLAAWQVGAAQVISFDLDCDSVAATQRLRAAAGNPDNWLVLQGSVLDAEFLAELPRADIVYSWGVLHHTGAMWDAVRACTAALKDDAVLYIALYCSDIYFDPPPAHWLEIKQRYNRANALTRRWMEWAYAWRTTIRPALRAGRSPLEELLARGHSRGMTYWTCVRDWLGGWPMEFASIAETKAFCGGLGLELLNIRAGEGNTEYLFRKAGARNYWDAWRAGHPLHPLRAPFMHHKGHCWRAALTDILATSADQPAEPSRVMLYEDGVPVGFPAAVAHHIGDHGTGRYLHRGDELLFSATDNSDPNTNGRSYSVCLDGL